MTTLRSRYPDLLKLVDPPLIVGGICRLCDYLTFPRDPYGCENCGSTSEEIDSYEFSPTGSIQAVATVHRHHHPHPEVPFNVAVINLYEGPLIKGIIEGHNPKVGSLVKGIIAASKPDSEGISWADLRFRLVQQ